MKRHGNLYEKVMTPENIEAAWEVYNSRRPARRRRTYDAKAAAKLLDDMKRDFAGVIGKPRVKTIREGGKERRLQIPSFRACVAMLALWNVCGGYVERRIHGNSYSSRRGMGGHKMAKKVARFVRTKGEAEAKYCLYFDIRKYYEHVDRRIMLDRLSTVFKDRRVIEMFRAVLDSTDRGLSIGYPFSHALANLYLTPLYFLLHSIRNISRIWVYMDNWLVFSRFKAPLKRGRQLAARWLEGMRCEMKHDWQIFPTRTRAARACGLQVWADGRLRLYRRLWRRTVAQFRRLEEFLRLHDYLGMMSRLGWLDMINGRFHRQFILQEGGYLWK